MPYTVGRARIEVWCLELLWSLVLGIWSFPAHALGSGLGLRPSVFPATASHWLVWGQNGRLKRLPFPTSRISFEPREVHNDYAEHQGRYPTRQPNGIGAG